TGLGLALCQAIVSSLGGEISAESEPGKGTTIKVILPAATALMPARTASVAGTQAALPSAPATGAGTRAALRSATTSTTTTTSATTATSSSLSSASAAAAAAP